MSDALPVLLAGPYRHYRKTITVSLIYLEGYLFPCVVFVYCKNDWGTALPGFRKKARSLSLAVPLSKNKLRCSPVHPLVLVLSPFFRRTSWDSCRGLDASEAMRRYAQLADGLCPPPRLPRHNSAGSAEEEQKAEGMGVGGEEEEKEDEYRAGAGEVPGINSLPEGKPSELLGNARANNSHGDASHIDKNPTDGGMSRADGMPRPDSGRSRSLGVAPLTAARGVVAGARHTGRRRAGNARRQKLELRPQTSSGWVAPAAELERGRPSGVTAAAAAAAAAVAVTFMFTVGVALLRGWGGGGVDDEARDLQREHQHQQQQQHPHHHHHHHHGSGSGWAHHVLRLPVHFSAAFAFVLALTAVAVGCLWCAVRVARWREEIFAGSPLASEALSRAAALGDNEDHSPDAETVGDEGDTYLGAGERAGAGAGGVVVANGQAKLTSGKSVALLGGLNDNAIDDPVGFIFRPGTRAARDFCAPPSTVDEGRLCTGMGAGVRAGVGVGVEVGAGLGVEADRGGAVVFLTGVTGLVGQMVLFDLLRQGQAVSKAFTDGRGDSDGGGVASRGLRKVVVLVRGKKGMTASDRLAAIRDSPMFHPLRASGAWVDEQEQGLEHADSEAGVTAGEGPTKAKYGVLVATATAATAASATNDATDGGNSASEAARPAPFSGMFCRRNSSGCTSSPRHCLLSNRVVGGATVTAVEGELGEEGLGLSVESRALLSDAGVTHSLHCAASVSFSDPLAGATATNVTGALRVAALVASWPSCG